MIPLFGSALDFERSQLALLHCLCFRKTLLLAQDLGDRAVEAQACYSLGNTYTLLRDYPTAIDYHLRHLRIAEELMDKVGEGIAMLYFHLL